MLYFYNILTKIISLNSRFLLAGLFGELAIFMISVLRSRNGSVLTQFAHLQFLFSNFQTSWWFEADFVHHRLNFHFFGWISLTQLLLVAKLTEYFRVMFTWALTAGEISTFGANCVLRRVLKAAHISALRLVRRAWFNFVTLIIEGPNRWFVSHFRRFIFLFWLNTLCHFKIARYGWRLLLFRIGLFVDSKENCYD